MKKLVSILLVLFEVLFCTAVYSETIDVKSMTVDELYSILEQVREELQLRMADPMSSRIGIGSYLVGEDIKAGSYDFVCLNTDTYSNGDPNNEIQLYTIVDGRATDGRTFARDCPLNNHVIFTLKEGMRITFEGCSGYIIPIELSWRP